jgi:hypothetical protein
MDERPETTDQPEPDDVLDDSAPLRTPDHEPADSDDRGVELDDPDSYDLPVDDDDRDPARGERESRHDRA